MNKVSNNALTATNCGELAGTAGDNGVGKLISSKTTMGAVPFDEGETIADGKAVVPSESIVGPLTETIGRENTHSKGHASGSEDSHTK